MDRREFLIASGELATLAMLRSLPAGAAGREDTLLVLVGDGPNSMDIHRSGTNRPSYQIAVNLYDRLVTFGSKTLEDGSVMYDYEDIQPELAESWEISDHGSLMTFHPRPDATFWDGSPVTAEDVKWSFDRAVSVGGFPTMQMGAGLLVEPDQFEAVDDRTFRIHMKEPSRLRIVAKRLVQALPSLFGIVLVTFVLTRALPGDPAVYFAGPAADAESIQQVRVNLGLDQPLPVRFLRYLGDLATGVSASRSTPGCRSPRSSGGACRRRWT